MNDAINKVFSLIQKTGDRCVVVSPDTDEAYVVLSLAEYERIVFGRTDVSELSEDALLDKINRDIAVWKSQQDDTRQSSAAMEAEHGLAKPDFDPYTDNLANERQNFDELFDVDDDSDGSEEPYYFEKV